MRQIEAGMGVETGNEFPQMRTKVKLEFTEKRTNYNGLFE